MIVGHIIVSKEYGRRKAAKLQYMRHVFDNRNGIIL